MVHHRTSRSSWRYLWKNGVSQHTSWFPKQWPKAICLLFIMLTVAWLSRTWSTMQTSEKQLLSEEIQHFTEASHWLQKALLETVSSTPISPRGACAICKHQIQTIRKILGNQKWFCLFQYLTKQQHGLKQGQTHRQWLDPVLTEANNKHSEFNGSRT